jgi:hypothetical protein
MSKEQNERARRDYNLEPLCRNYNFKNLIETFEFMSTRKLEAVERAMKTCTTSNCPWYQYRLSILFLPSVKTLLTARRVYGTY